MDLMTFGGSGRTILLMFIDALFYHTTPSRTPLRKPQPGFQTASLFSGNHPFNDGCQLNIRHYKNLTEMLQSKLLTCQSWFLTSQGVIEIKPTRKAEDRFIFLAQVGLTKHYGSLDATPEIIDALHQEGWVELLVETDFVTGVGQGCAIEPAREGKGRFKRYGNSVIFKTIPRMIKLILTDISSRSFLKDGISGLTRDILTYVGYGVYTGQKPWRHLKMRYL
jgi:hypothetical protein